MTRLNFTKATVCLVACATAAVAAEPFADSFEGNSIYPYWAVSQQFGTVALSRDQSYAGSQAVKFASVSGGERTMTLTHTFARTKGDVSIAFYDYAPGQETLYEHLEVSDSRNPSIAAFVGTQDFDSQCYTAYFNGGGPNANCGIYPQLATAPVKRTPGWHVFSVYYDQSSVSIWIDGQSVYAATGSFQFDTAQIEVSGPYWRPNTVAYFDNFSFIPLPANGWAVSALIERDAIESRSKAAMAPVSPKIGIDRSFHNSRRHFDLLNVDGLPTAERNLYSVWHRPHEGARLVDKPLAAYRRSPLGAFARPVSLPSASA